jgi:hypothetical protein
MLVGESARSIQGWLVHPWSVQKEKISTINQLQIQDHFVRVVAFGKQ